jgi:malonyl CoA-acyl carrier protein transacylase
MFLLSGERSQVEEAMVEALDAGAFSAKTFPCDAPLHTPFMEEAEEDLRAIIADYRYGEPTCRLLDHLNQDYLTAADMYDFLYLELLRPVYWEKSYRALRTAGARVFIEVAAGDALRKYNRWIDSELKDCPPGVASECPFDIG